MLVANHGHPCLPNQSTGMRIGKRSRGGLLIICLLLAACVGAVGQDIASQAQRPPAETSRRNLQEREQWFLRGRSIAGQPGAALLYRAYQQKLAMRAERSTLVPRGLSAAPRASGALGWMSLGPAPLASDASGTGAQDYNWVSGRSTAVAVDPADQSGNTV